MRVIPLARLKFVRVCTVDLYRVISVLLCSDTVYSIKYSPGCQGV